MIFSLSSLHLLVLWKLVLSGELSHAVCILWVLCSKCMIPLAIDIYLQLLEVNHSKSSSLHYFEESFGLPLSVKRKRVLVPSTGFFVSLWMLEIIIVITIALLFSKINKYFFSGLIIIFPASLFSSLLLHPHSLILLFLQKRIGFQCISDMLTSS